MRKSKKFLISAMLITALTTNTITSLSVSAIAQGPTKKTATVAIKEDFSKGTKIAITNITSMQQQTLYKLGKIWGFIKYYHPKIAEGKIKWDYELFKIIQRVISLNDSRKVDKALCDLINSLGKLTVGTVEKPEGKVAIAPDLDWIKDSKFISSDLSKLLQNVEKAKRTGKNYYVYLDENVGNPIFVNEDVYKDMKFTDDGCKLLALFRYWNMVEYFFPYKDIIDEDWDKVLLEFIPKMVKGDTAFAYKMNIAELIGKLGDGDAIFNPYNPTFDEAYGKNYAPVELKMIENKIVVTKVVSELVQGSIKLQAGDVIKKIDGKDVMQVLKEKETFMPKANKVSERIYIFDQLVRTKNSTMKFEVERGKETFEDNVKCYNLDKVEYPKDKTASHKLIGENIGYIYPASLQSGEIFKIMEEFKDTKGIIVDLRCYPSDFLVFSLGSAIMNKSNPFVKFTIGSTAVPGRFEETPVLSVGGYNPDYYKGKVIILIDEGSMSQPEYTTMALRTAPNATVVGSNTAGADGNVSEIMLPGNIKSYISGIGVFYPDGRQTQRLGVSPDVEVRPTIEGIRNGKDELVDKAVELINK